MTLDQQIHELQAHVADGEQLTVLLPHVLQSLLRLRQIEQPRPTPGTNTTYTSCVELYDAWHKQQVGVRMRFNAAEGKAMKDIIKYLSDECAADESMVLNTWRLILERWSTLNQFLGSQTKLVQINKNLTEIIVKIKAHATNQRGHTQQRVDSISDKL
jgi:hypothetical protein